MKSFFWTNQRTVWLRALLTALLMIHQIGHTDSEQELLSLEQIQRFTSAISHIKHFYVQDTSDEKLISDAIRGMVERDSHSTFLDESDFQDLKTSTRGEFGGLGIEVTMEEGVVKVIAPIDGTPAEKAGIEAGDYITRINHKPVRGMKLKDAVDKMRGKKGSKIDLTVIRQRENKPLTFTLVRDVIQIQSIKHELLSDAFGYVRISHFQTKTAPHFLKAITDLKRQARRRNNHLKGLVLDLRNNPGGLLQAAIQISDALIHNDQVGEEEMIVFTKGRAPHSHHEAIASPGDLLEGSPIVVLINPGSASASEIVAGALQDHGRALLVGQRSFGKGSVQTVFPLSDKQGIKLTTALYYTPSGRSIQAQGLIPDIELSEQFTPRDSEQTLAPLTESDLKDHIKQRTDKDKSSHTAQSKTSDLLKQDHQLAQAFNILKAIALTQSSSPQRKPT